MSILIVGGAGVIGGDAALYFRAAGHDVSIAGRREPQKGPMTQFPFVRIDYIADSDPVEVLKGFATVISNQPPEAETALLGYRRGDVRRIIDEAVSRYRSS